MSAQAWKWTIPFLASPCFSYRCNLLESFHFDLFSKGVLQFSIIFFRDPLNFNAFLQESFHFHCFFGGILWISMLFYRNPLPCVDCLKGSFNFHWFPQGILWIEFILSRNPLISLIWFGNPLMFMDFMKGMFDFIYFLQESFYVHWLPGWMLRCFCILWLLSIFQRNPLILIYPLTRFRASFWSQRFYSEIRRFSFSFFARISLNLIYFPKVFIDFV